jgi:hypothetical protein
MGRHAADDEAAVHPIVAAALERRAAGSRADEPVQGGLGWPGDPTEGTGLGWPAGTDSRDRAVEPAVSAPADLPVTEPSPVGPPAVEAPPVALSVPAPRRSVWRRIFGGGSVPPAEARRVTSSA